MDLSSAPITSTSQLLPLLVAAFSAMVVLWVAFWRVFLKAWKAAVEDWARGKPSLQHPVYPPRSAPFVTAYSVGGWLHEDFFFNTSSDSAAPILKVTRLGHVRLQPRTASFRRLRLFASLPAFRNFTIYNNSEYEEWC